MAHSKGSDKEARYGFLESGKRLHKNFLPLTVWLWFVLFQGINAKQAAALMHSLA